MNSEFEEELEESGTGDRSDQAGGGKQSPQMPTREEFEQLNMRLAEMAEEARHNRELLAQFLSRQTQPAAEPDKDEEIEDDTDVADDFAANGIQALVKRGVLTKREAQEMVREEARRIAREEVERSRESLIRDAELARQYPELANEQSELFKRTQAIYQEMTQREPSLKNSAQTLPMAARLAKAELIAEGRQDARQDRIMRQSGDRGYSSRYGGFDDDSNELSPTQRAIIERFNASGEAEISEEGYRKRAQSVKMGGIRGLR
jgi:hypothetical protein